MANKTLLLVLLYVVSSPLVAQQPKVTPLMSRDLTDLPGKEGLMITVEYAPGGSDPIHRHNAHAFVYVLEGSVVMQVKGGKEVTLTPGQSFYEGPNDVHVVGRNASSTKPAKFLGRSRPAITRASARLASTNGSTAPRPEPGRHGCSLPVLIGQATFQKERDPCTKKSIIIAAAFLALRP
jgi:quercetin dioxygenase-like cupin family protein